MRTSFGLSGWKAQVYPAKVPGAVVARGEPLYHDNHVWEYDALGVSGDEILVFDSEENKVASLREMIARHSERHSSVGMAKGWRRTVAYTFRGRLVRD